jgi:hypothetical protein
MEITEQLAALAGKWKGMNRLNLFFMPNPIFESPSNAIVWQRVNGTRLEIEYNWVYEGKSCEGFIEISCENSGDANAVWTDTWLSRMCLRCAKAAQHIQAVLIGRAITKSKGILIGDGGGDRAGRGLFQVFNVQYFS